MNFEDSITYRLSSIIGVDAIYIDANDADGVIHVYSIVPEFDSDLTDKLINAEELVREDQPNTRFEFHTRAHQGRNPFKAAPLFSKALFTRNKT